jgi:peptide/nickel transport system substrate-binding protein
MRRVAAAAALALMVIGGTATAQKPGGVLRVHLWDSPPNLSMLDGVNPLAARTMAPVFNNLAIFDQHAKQSRLDAIVPDLATSWTWNEDGTELTFRLRRGVKWHDGRPFTANDVKCTWDLILDKGPEKLRTNARKSWYKNLEEVTTNGDDEVTFRLKRPQPAFLMLIATGWSPIYPCHVPEAQMRQRPIGSGPFKFVEFKPNESVRLTRNPDYWKPGLPYLDGIEFPVIKNMSTAVLAFVSGRFDMIWPYSLTAPLLKDVQSQMPQAICEVTPNGGIYAAVLINRDKPPFDNPDLRHAMALSLDRKAFIDILDQGQGDIGGVLQPLPEGLWGMPPELLKELPGYDPRRREKPRSGASNHAEGRLWAREAPADQDFDTRPPATSQYRGAADRSAETDLYRRRARNTRHQRLFSQDSAQGFHRRSQRSGWRARSGPDARPVLRLWVEPQLGRLLQCRSRQNDRAAVHGGRRRAPQADIVGD